MGWHQGSRLRRSGTVPPRCGALPSDFSTVRLLRPLMQRPLPLLPLLLRLSLLRAVLLRSLPWLWLPRLSLLRRGRHCSGAICLAPGGTDAGAAVSPS